MLQLHLPTASESGAEVGKICEGGEKISGNRPSETGSQITGCGAHFP